MEIVSSGGIPVKLPACQHRPVAAKAWRSVVVAVCEPTSTGDEHPRRQERNRKLMLDLGPLAPRLALLPLLYARNNRAAFASRSFRVVLRRRHRVPRWGTALRARVFATGLPQLGSCAPVSGYVMCKTLANAARVAGIFRRRDFRLLSLVEARSSRVCGVQHRTLKG